MVGKSKHNGQHSTHIGSFVKHNGSYFDQVRGEGWPAGCLIACLDRAAPLQILYEGVVGKGSGSVLWSRCSGRWVGLNI